MAERAEPGNQAAMAAFGAPEVKTSALAIGAVALAVLGGPLFGLVLGGVARRHVRASGGALKGERLANAAMMIGGLWLALYALVGILAAAGAFD